jgi:serine/threonine protein kinase
MPLAPGTRLGPYEVVDRIGVGGMGVVYRGRDTRLRRDVALKVLPDLVAGDPGRLARFRREAQVLAALNHPNIGGIYGVEDANGIPALVLELVEGSTLADRIAQGPMPLDEALPTARQIADALEAAHGQGIIHRDLKPANIKVRPDGTVKLLDFGLAKACDPELSPDSSSSPTITGPVTRPGLILGTAAYMSPEQARGKAVDKHADIWAFGCVVYEMLAGKRAFDGDTVSDTLAAIMRGEPDWNALGPSTPWTIRRLLRRCLTKEPKDRLHDIGDAALEIRDALTMSDAELQAISPPFRAGRAPLTWPFAAVLLGGLVLVLVLVPYLRRTPTDTRTFRTSILLPPDLTLAPTLAPSSRFALSPDGRRLAFVVRVGDRNLLSMRSLDALAAQPLAGTEDAAYPFWSPDSRFLAFFAKGQLKRIDVSGGPPVTLAHASAPLPGSWNRDGVILFTGWSGRLYRVPASGGTPSPVTSLDGKSGDTAHASPFFLPDGQHFLYLAVGSTATGPNEDRALYVGSLDSEEPRLLLQGGANAMYAQGHLIFLRQNTLMAQPFDVTALKLTGDAVPIAEQVQIGRQVGSRGAFSVSETGVLAYQVGSTEVRSQLLWLDRAGRAIGPVGEPAEYGDIWLSPDAKHIVTSVLDPARMSRDIWRVDVESGLRTRLTFGPMDEESPIWSPDGSRVVFCARPKGPCDLYQKASSGVGAEEALLEDGVNKLPTGWSPDGRFVLYYRPSTSGENDIWVLPLFGDRQPFPFLQTPFNEAQGRFSPDGRWVAYVSFESGRPEVYVAPFPSATGKWRISTAGGSWPLWRRDGKELFYVQSQNKLMAAAVDGVGSVFKVGAARLLFETGWKSFGNPCVASGDGQRFLVNMLAEETTSVPITLVVNWPALLKE